jgi:hypothetical protein
MVSIKPVGTKMDFIALCGMIYTILLFHACYNLLFIIFNSLCWIEYSRDSPGGLMDSTQWWC